MNLQTSTNATRRDFLKHTGRITAASVLASMVVPRVHAAENNTIQLALIGCGGRGTGAVRDALNTHTGPVKLVAMADAFKDRVDSSHAALKKQFGDGIEISDDRKFIGLDAYKNAMDCLKPGDIAIFATPMAFRCLHFGYAVKRHLNVFMEKPLTADGPTSRRTLKLAKESVANNLKVGVGLKARHSRAFQQAAHRIHDGEIGNILLLRGYRMHGPIVGYCGAKPTGMNELEFQIRKFHAFLWASGGTFSDFYIHMIDYCCWMKDLWPVKAMALGGRHVRMTADGAPCVDQNLDVYCVEYSFADGAKFIMDGRSIVGCENVYASYAQGTKGLAILSNSGDCGLPSSTYKGQLPKQSNLIWQSKIAPAERNAFQNEWNDLIDAIRNNKPYNEAQSGVEASLVTSMGRMSAHVGRTITFDEMLNSEHEYAPNLDKLTFDGPAPIMPNAKGEYPVPQPGIAMDREC